MGPSIPSKEPVITDHLRGVSGSEGGTSGPPRLGAERVPASRERARGGFWTVLESCRWSQKLDQGLVEGS